MGATTRPSTRGLPLDLRGADVTKRPVQILHPAKVQKGRPRARWQDVFRVWKREIVKPDFDITHAAKAVRLLPKLQFWQMPEKEPVFMNLMNRTRRLLREGQPGGQEVGSMIRACAALRNDLPQLQAHLLPSLAGLIPQTIGEMSAVDIKNLVIASAELKNDVPELWEVMPSQLDVIAERAGDIEVRDFPALLAVIRTMTDVDGKVGRALEALQEQAVERLGDFGLQELAMLLWVLEEDADPRLLAAVSKLIVENARTWSPKAVHPELWRLVCAYAKLGTRDLPVLKAVARRALADRLDTLGSWGLSALAWSYGQLQDEADGLADFRRHLALEVERRELSEELVSQSFLGPDGGGNATLKALWSEGPKAARNKTPLLAPRPSLFKLLGK